MALGGHPSRVFHWRFWSRRSGLNRRPADYESAALPTELRRPGAERPFYQNSTAAHRLESVPMQISRILAYRVALPLHETSYKWSGGKSVTVFDSTIVRVETDAGVVG